MMLDCSLYDHVGPRSSLKSAAIIKVCCWLPGISHHVGADACAKRLSLLRALSELPKGTSEREVQMYLEHVCPREHEQARRAICRLEQARRAICRLHPTDSAHTFHCRATGRRSRTRTR